MFVLAFAENAIGKDVYKPGDIIKSLKGLTVEIGNTDAEGRLVLADALTYTCSEYKPKKVIDIATLTGAVMVALGKQTAGLFSNDDDLAKALLASSDAVNEPIWRLPIVDEHRESIKRLHADLNNKGKSPYGGSSIAAAFLEKFVEKGVNGETPKWAHLDIAGACMDESKTCTGFGAAILLDLI